MSALFYDGVDHMIEKITTLIKGKANNSHTHTKNDITDFPTLGTASSKDVASSGNASATQVVMGNDTRLSDARKASDVSAWAKASSKPSYTKSEIGLGNVDNTADANKNVKYATSAGSASSASKATEVVDYGATTNTSTIQIGYAGKGATTDNLTHIAGYIENGTRIKDVSKDTLKLGLGSLAYSSATIPTIPSSLPANGGNASTVNGHTVESDVPSNAKFTDTVYDDTEVQKRISDNGYGEVAGGKNLLNHNIIDSKIKNCSVLFKNDTFYVTNKGSYSKFVLSVPTIVGKSYTVTIKDWSDYSYRCIASVSDLSDNSLVSMVITDATLSMTFTAVGTESLINISPNNTPNEMSNTITFKCMLEEGSVATEYEPYFPSNNMLAEENEQQNTEAMDLKMLGWSVPRECPIQNEVNGNQFIQKVGRVDLGSLNWKYDTITGHERFRTVDTDTSYIKPVQANNALANAYSNIYVVNSADSTYLHVNDKSIAIDTSSIIWVYDTSYADATTFKSAMQGQYLYYELATPITTMIDGNEIGETVSDVRKETTVNLLPGSPNPWPKNGVTCAYNGDGTYTLTGTATADTSFTLTGNIIKEQLSDKLPLKLLGGVSNNVYVQYLNMSDANKSIADKGTGGVIINDAMDNCLLCITIVAGETLPNVVVKPMLTTNLDATYDDFVAHTGDSGKLNSDVANINSDVAEVNTELGTKADKEKYGDTVVSVGRKSDSAIGDNSFAFGNDTTASGAISHAEGLYTTASGNFSHAEGNDTTASGEGSHAEGNNTTASGAYSHAEGQQNTASVFASHVEGSQNTATGYNSHAEGNGTTATGYASHAEGYHT